MYAAAWRIMNRNVRLFLLKMQVKKLVLKHAISLGLGISKSHFVTAGFFLNKMEAGTNNSRNVRIEDIKGRYKKIIHNGM